MRMTMDEIASCLKTDVAGLACDNGIICSVATDSKKISKNGLFVCIKGQKADGHDFVTEALKNGASAILAQKPLPQIPIPVFVVEDTVKALGKLATCWRNKTGAIVVGVTGTAGKTTLKEVLSSILSEHGKVAKSQLNHNNQIGLPISILETDGDEKFWIMEAGISHDGDMDDLGAILNPDIGLVLNAGAGHLEGLAKKGVAWHKARLFNYLAPGGKAVICADYPELVQETKKYGVEFVTFTTKPQDHDLEWYSRSRDDTDETCELMLDGNICKIKMPLSGEAGEEVSIAAGTCAALLGLSISEISSGFSNVKLPPQRFNEETIASWHVIDDSYNANPLSMKRMLQIGKAKANSLGRPFYAILGEMGELGRDTGILHEELGKTLGELKPDFVFFKGKSFEDFRKGFLAIQPCNNGKLYLINDASDFESLLKKTILQGQSMNTGGVILFKGSRSNKLEMFVRSFKEIIVPRVAHNVL